MLHLDYQGSAELPVRVEQRVGPVGPVGLEDWVRKEYLATRDTRVIVVKADGRDGLDILVLVVHLVILENLATVVLVDGLGGADKWEQLVSLGIVESAEHLEYLVGLVSQDIRVNQDLLVSLVYQDILVKVDIQGHQVTPVGLDGQERLVLVVLQEHLGILVKADIRVFPASLVGADK